MSTPLISIVIPVKNGDTWLKNLFENLSLQTLFNECEIIVIDSGSSDNSLEICKKYDVTIYQIEPETFNHGLTRNLGVQLSRGQYVLMTVQDALPEKNTLLEQMVNSFSDKEIAAVCGSQVVPELPNTSPFNWDRPISVPEIYFYQFKDVKIFDQLLPNEKKKVCSWDNVCAMYRSEVIRKIPFRQISFGEDMAWCKDAIRAGLKICYNPKAKVFHYHTDDKDYLFNRTLTEFYSFFTLFDYVPKRGSTMQLLKRIISLMVKEKKTSFRRKLYWIGKEIRFQMIIDEATNHFLEYLNKGNMKPEYLYNNIDHHLVQAPKP